MLQGETFPKAEPAPQARRFADAFAALDLGTNNCRLLVGAPAGSGFRVLDSFSRIVRLGEGLHRTGELSEAAMTRALAALHACTARLQHRNLRGVRAIATEACRQAANGAEFLCRVRAETGLQIEVISAREEAELALESCAQLLIGDARRALLFDIGGGSTELAWVRLDAARLPALIGQGGVLLLGTSGTVTTLAGIALNLIRYSRPLVDGAVLTREEARAALGRLCAMGRAGLERSPCVGPERVDFVLPGCAIFAAIVRLWPAPKLVVADRGLREGMLLRMIRGGARPVHRNGYWPRRP
jgi:exopolyphosphatase/guanosine-5'-triphosphate,3'-diphosphate pyrophosphatase